ALDAQGWTYRAFYPNVTLMRQIAREISVQDWDMPTFTSPSLIDPQLSQQLATLHRAIEYSKTPLVKDTLFRQAIGLLIRKHANNQNNKLRISRDNRAVAIAQEYLQTHYAEDVSLEDIAHEACLSPYHLSRIFKEQLGLPPYKY